MLIYVLLLLVGCKSSEQLTADQKCAAAIQALDADGDLYLPEGALPDSCDMSWEDAISLLSEDGYQAGDCDDDDASVNPGVEDVCGDDVDQDCDGSLPEISTRYTDDDGDGYGDATSGADMCGAPTGTVENGDDCDDLNPEVSPDGVETACADDVDSDCDGVTDCAVAGTMNAAVWAELGVTETLGSGAGRAMDAGQDVDGDGLPDVLVGGTNAAWTVAYGGRQANASELSLGFGESDDAGADVALMPDFDGDGLGEIVVGGPSYDFVDAGSFGVDIGRAAVRRSGSADSGWLLGANKNEYAGGALASAEGLLAVARLGTPTSWEVNLLSPGHLPAAGTTVAFEAAELEVDATCSASGSEGVPPALSIATATDGWLMAVGQPEDDSDGKRAKLISVVDTHATTKCSVYIADDGDDETVVTFGSSILLADVTGDGKVDLIVGDPGAKSVYVFEDAATCADTLAPGDASTTIKLNPVTDFGSALASVPDMNGDGIDELLVSGANTVVLFLGSPDGMSDYATLSGPAGFGASIAGADVDGDGFGDLIIGASGSGDISVLWGGPPTLD